MVFSAFNFLLYRLPKFQNYTIKLSTSSSSPFLRCIVCLILALLKTLAKVNNVPQVLNGSRKINPLKTNTDCAQLEHLSFAFSFQVRLRLLEMKLHSLTPPIPSPSFKGGNQIKSQSVARRGEQGQEENNERLSLHFED